MYIVHITYKMLSHTPPPLPVWVANFLPDFLAAEVLPTGNKQNILQHFPPPLSSVSYVS